MALREAGFSARAGEVHALLGENGAGKSTFIQILSGAVKPSSGTLRFGGKPFGPANTKAAQRAGISAVFQELSLVPDLTVAQNIWFGNAPLTWLGTIRTGTLRRKTRALFARFNIPPIDPDREVRRLTLADRQIVEIAKGLARDPAVLILDEATSALAPRETEWLLGLSTRLARDGLLVIFISHRLAEVRAVADRITVFRNGATVATYRTADVSDGQIIADMLGRRLDRLYPRAQLRPRPAPWR